MSEIRPARSGADLEAVRALFREYEAWVAEPCCFAGFERELAELPGEYGVLLLAEQAGAPAGCVGVRRLRDGAAAMCARRARAAGWGGASPKRPSTRRAPRAAACSTSIPSPR
jgi:hypothetical protein